MEDSIVEIINGLLCTDTERIHQCTEAIMKAYNNPLAMQTLCEIVASNRESQIRQMAAVLLNKRLYKLRQWLSVPNDQKEAIKACMLQALFTEKEKTVKNAIAQFVGTLVRHQGDKNTWLTELLTFLYARCRSEDEQESEFASSIFATLADSAPDQFVNHLGGVCQMFSEILFAADARGNLVTPTVLNITRGMIFLMPFVTGHTIAEQIILKSMPLIIKCQYGFACKGDYKQFLAVFDIMDSISQYVPKLLNNNVKTVMELCMEMANNRNIDSNVRVQVIYFIGRLARLKKKAIVKQKLLQPILSELFEIICSEVDTKAADEFFSGEGSSTPATSATQSLDMLALNMAPDKIIPPLLQILEPALQSPEPLRRRSALLCMAVIVEGCAEAITSKYLEVMVNVITNGITDSEPTVRIAAFFALGQFSEYLQPEISNFAPKILPVLFDFLERLVVELRLGQPEPSHMDRMFYALETYCEYMEDGIVPYLPMLMDRLFITLHPRYSVNVRHSALAVISCTSSSAKENMRPYFSKIVEHLKSYLVKDCENSMKQLRIQAIDTLAGLARAVGKESFLPLANDTMVYCLAMLEDGPDDPEVRRAIYNLVAALTYVVNEDMAAVLPKIMERIIETIISTDDMLPGMSDSDLKNSCDGDVDAPETEIDLETTDNEDDGDEPDAFQVENDFVHEKEEAILALLEFANNTGSSFAPYLQISFENVYKVIDHPHDSIRKACIESIIGFVLALYKLGDIEGVKRACAIVMPKFSQIVRNDDEPHVVINLLDSLAELFKVVKEPAVPSPDVAEAIFTCIKDVLIMQTVCQSDETSGGCSDEDELDNSEFEELLIENAGNLLPSFGCALDAQTFSLYFGRLCPILLARLNKGKKNNVHDQRAAVYGVLGDCCQSLSSCAIIYFDTLLPVFLAGMTDTEPKSRQNTFYGVGELVMAANEKSYPSFPHILQALSEAIAKETNDAALDNICGAVARLILTNHSIMPLHHVLPVLMSHLPLREDKDENETLLRTFHMLFKEARPSIQGFIDKILAITLDMMYKKEIPSNEKTNAITFVNELRTCYPDTFGEVITGNAEIYNFVKSL